MTRLISTMIVLALVVVTGLAVAAYRRERRIAISHSQSPASPARRHLRNRALPRPPRPASPTGESNARDRDRAPRRHPADERRQPGRMAGLGSDFQPRRRPADRSRPLGALRRRRRAQRHLLTWIAPTAGPPAPASGRRPTAARPGAVLPVLWGAPLRRIIFADRNRGWALGDGLLLRTEDGGATWGVAYVDHWHHEPLLEYQPPNDLWTPQMYTACYDSNCEYFGTT